MTIRALLTVLLGVAAGLGAVAAPAVASPPPPRQLGAPDLGGYCRSLGYADAIALGRSAYDWHCRAGDRYGDLTLDAACRWTYGTPQAVDRIADFWRSGSVQCWRVRDDVIAPDLDRYCRTTGADGAVLVGADAYSWRCVTGGDEPAYVSVDMPAACRESTYGYATIDRFVDFLDPYSWQCRV
ncbi:hypothetical protein ACFQFC_09210 [Amorphoplanes digitatis]|uniref:Uncharacterized protein n=1 Tax=Actinoplanes digitatis TaxID=1868 RepID=A0A7W7I0T3_9ACTN|nr:hypothetical protein [Actinoplanes digitatis]MBB4764369.1 hypothetical protein [Actinoplanes digitatis]BFE73788.1 hypothetical protein GCM10020092_070890 [Actinoplanes digitatis]GID94145.1 hypothetical protein Adi01nite_35570 [Actinoplanes digitatis]